MLTGLKLAETSVHSIIAVLSGVTSRVEWFGLKLMVIDKRDNRDKRDKRKLLIDF